MARMTYIEIVRDINLAVNQGEYIFTIDQTMDSTRITEIVKETYYRIIDARNWPQLWELTQLLETSALTPTHLTIPERLIKLTEFRYDKARAGDTRTKYANVRFLEPNNFLSMLNKRVSDAANIDTITDPSGLPLLIRNDIPPSHYTSFTDESVVLDSYDSAVESFLTTAKNQCYGRVYPSVTRDDEFVFDLPVEAFSYLLAEAKSTAMFAMRGFQDAKSEQHSNTQRRRLAWEAWNIDKKNRYPDFGRRGCK